jgi:hypothetical protein
VQWGRQSWPSHRLGPKTPQSGDPEQSYERIIEDWRAEEYTSQVLTESFAGDAMRSFSSLTAQCTLDVAGKTALRVKS